MDLERLALHVSAHLLLTAVICLILRLGWPGLFLAFLATTAVDLDHVPFIKRRGIAYWFQTAWCTPIPRKFPLHNFAVWLVCAVGSGLIFHPTLFILGVCFLSAAAHLLWDFLEDVAILKMGTDHWR